MWVLPMGRIGPAPGKMVRRWGILASQRNWSWWNEMNLVAAVAFSLVLKRSCNFISVTLLCNSKDTTEHRNLPGAEILQSVLSNDICTYCRQTVIYFNSTCTFESCVLLLNQSTWSVFINVCDNRYKHCMKMRPESAVGNMNFLLFVPEWAANTEHPGQTAFLYSLLSWCIFLLFIILQFVVERKIRSSCSKIILITWSR